MPQIRDFIHEKGIWDELVALDKDRRATFTIPSELSVMNKIFKFVVCHNAKGTLKDGQVDGVLTKREEQIAATWHYHSTLPNTTTGKAPKERAAAYGKTKPIQSLVAKELELQRSKRKFEKYKMLPTHSYIYSPL